MSTLHSTAHEGFTAGKACQLGVPAWSLDFQAPKQCNGASRVHSPEDYHSFSSTCPAVLELDLSELKVYLLVFRYTLPATDL